ncbi:MAG: hypothetical protein IJG57_01845 [Firmicutes bacterium]|nr:hypothetical protein [Bacillota bacterium]
MRAYIKRNRVFFILIALAVIAALIVTAQRMIVEKSDRTVDFILDYKEAELLAEQSPHDVGWWLKEFAGMGITKVGLQEESLKTLTKSEEPVKAELVTELRQDTYWLSQAPEEVLEMIDENVEDDFDVLVIAESQEMFSFIKRAFEVRYDPKKVTTLQTDDGGYILIDGTVEDALYGETEVIGDSESVGFEQYQDMKSSKIMYLNLGMLADKVKIIQNAGCTVEPRTSAYEGWNDKRFFNDVVKQYAKLKVDPNYWIMANKVIPAYDEEEDGVKILADYLDENDITIGIVENTNQRANIDPDGLEELVQATDYNVVRVFSVWPYIQFRYEYYGYDSYQEIENSLFRAIVERNIKVIYYKPMKEKDDNYTYITDVKEYRESFASLEKRLARHGIRIGQASPSKPYQVPFWAKLLIAVGAGCAGLLCLKQVLPIRNRWLYLLLILGTVGAAGALRIAPNLAGQLTSMAASVFMGCLAVIWMIRKSVEDKKKVRADAGLGAILTRGIIVLAGGLLVSLAGAIMTAAPISSINFMLEMDIYRGVKFAQLLPLAFFALVFCLYALWLWGEKKKTTLEIRDVKWIMNYDIKVWIIAVVGLLGALGYVYLARTGHETGMDVSTFELVARNFLEEILYARPRTKEFLVAFPAVMLFVYSMIRNQKVWAFVFGLAGTIGFTSVINTFMHIRTPMELGFARTAYSVIFGVVLGVLYVVVFDVICRLFRKWGTRYNA